MSVSKEVTQKIETFVQSRIDQFHTDSPRTYTSTTPNGVEVSRIGISVYLESDKQVENIAGVLAKLSEDGKAGQPNPMIVDVDGSKFVIVSSMLSTQENNFSKRPKLILADHMLGSNAEIDGQTRKQKLNLLLQMRESNKVLKADNTIAKAKKELVSVSEDEFDATLLS